MRALRCIGVASTQRIYLEDARRKTALANVSAHAAGGFLLDRSLFFAPDARYQHKQPCDRGHIIADGHKLKIHNVNWHRDQLIHRTHGPVPAVGAKAQLHLDADRRDQQARAHTVMHIAVAAILDERHELLQMPEIVGGGHVNFHARLRDKPADTLPRLLSRIQQVIGQRLDVTTTWMPRDTAAKAVTHHPIGLDAIAPQEPTLRLTHIGEKCTLPCDAPLVENTREIGAVFLMNPRVTNEGVRWQFKVYAPER